jgi:hypothetical protein
MTDTELRYTVSRLLRYFKVSQGIVVGPYALQARITYYLIGRCSLSVGHRRFMVEYCRQVGRPTTMSLW